MESLTVRNLLRTVGVVSLVAMSMVVASPASPLRAATLTVTTLDDVVNANDGVLSLREAVTAAGTNDVIDFSSSLFTSGPQVINMTDPMGRGGTFDIRGPGKDLLTIRGPRSDRTMVGYSIASNVLTVTLSSAPAFTASAGGIQGRVLIHGTTAPITGEHVVTSVSGNTFTANYTAADRAFTSVTGEVTSSLVSHLTGWGLAGRFLEVTGGSIGVHDVTIEGFMAERGGAFHVKNGATLRLDDVRLRRNAAFNWYNCGGAIKADRGNLDIRDSIFVENLGKCDGAINMGDGNGTTMYIEDTSFIDNVGGVNGWAITSYLPTQMVNVTVRGTTNYAGAAVGAFFMSGFAMPLSITGSDFTGASPGPVRITNHSAVTISGSTFNTTDSNPALYLDNSFVSLTSNTIESCTTTGAVGIHTSTGNSFTQASNCALENSTSGAKLVSFTRASNTVTMTTATAHGFSVGDVVKLCGAQAFSSAGWCGLTPTIISVPSSTTFTFSHTGSDAATTVITAEAARGAYVFDQIATGPGAPTITGATAGNAQVLLTWSAPASGSASITDYLIQFSKDGGSWTTYADGVGTGTNRTITGLENGASYRFRVAAVTSVATGNYSTQSSAVVPAAPGATTTTTVPPTTTVPSNTTVPANNATTTVPASSVATVPAQGGVNQAVSAPVQNTLVTTTTTVAGATTTTTTTVAATTTTTTTIPAPEAPSAEPGSAGALVDGEEVEATVSRLNNALVVDVGGINATVWGISPTGERINLDETGNLRLNEQDSIVVEADGFEAGQEVEVWMFSTPTQLGTLVAGADGAIAGTFPLPASVPAGDHRVVLQGANALGQDVTVGIGLFVGAPSGDGVSPWVIWVPVSLAVGLGLIIPTTLRRRRRAEEAAN